MLLDYFLILLNTNVKILAYVLVYNYTLIALFWIFYSKMLTNKKTLSSISFYKFDSFNIFALTIILLSLAGVPPFLGFFTKIFIILMLINSNFLLYFIFFMSFLLLNLYFYLCNIRFLHAPGGKRFRNYHYRATEFIMFKFFTISMIIIMWLSVSPFFIDDLILFLFWILL